MHSFDQPVDAEERTQPADALDGLLRNFYRAKMPSPWPTLWLPESSARHRSTGWQFRSRAALAATVALLVIGSFFLAKGVSDPLTTSNAASTPLGDPQGDKNLNDRMIQDQKARET